MFWDTEEAVNEDPSPYVLLSQTNVRLSTDVTLNCYLLKNKLSQAPTGIGFLLTISMLTLEAVVILLESTLVMFTFVISPYAFGVMVNVLVLSYE